jgi:hypothetical protein
MNVPHSTSAPSSLHKQIKRSWDFEMRIFVAILAAVALLLGALYDTAASPRYERVLTAALICEVPAGTGFIFLFKTGRGFPKYISLIGLALCIVIMGDAISRLLYILTQRW